MFTRINRLAIVFFILLVIFWLNLDLDQPRLVQLSLSIRFEKSIIEHVAEQSGHFHRVEMTRESTLYGLPVVRHNLTGLFDQYIHETPNTALIAKQILSPDLTECRRQVDKSSPRLLLLVLVIAAPKNFDQRQQIRQTWGNYYKNVTQIDPYDMRVVFSVAKTNETGWSERIEREFHTYQDIIQADFYDAYKKLTMKVMNAFAWASHNCPNAEYVLRINDDVVVNTPALVSLLKEIKSRETSSDGGEFLSSPRVFRANTMMCVVLDAIRVERNLNSKFHVSREEFAGDKYLPYCEGSAYLMTSDMPGRLVNLYTRLDAWYPFSIWLEDVYVGMLSHHLDTRFVPLHDHFYPPSQYEGLSIEGLVQRQQQLKNSSNTRRYPLFFVYIHNRQEFETVWRLLTLLPKN